MKKFIPFAVLVILLGTLPFLSFKTYSEKEALDAVIKQFHVGLEDFTSAINNYQIKINELDNTPASVDSLQKAHLETRLAFKRIEFFLNYFDNEGITRYINGAPLPKVEPKVPEVRVIEPCGLQTMDELAFSEDPLAEKEALKALGNKLSADYKSIRSYQNSIPITHRHIFEAVRYELIRVFTLSVTGFDTPGSVNAIPEAKEAMESLSRALEPYYPLIREKRLALFIQLISHFDISQEFFKKYKDFDTFDRMQFLKKVINPLYSFVLRAHHELGIETREETTDIPLAVNYESTNIFSDDFLDFDFYANLHVSEDVYKKRVALGKLLFFDPILSSNNERSCASCHDPNKAFTDGLKTSLAYGGEGHIKRNSPTLINSVYAEKYFYDFREVAFEKQMKHVIVDSLEFATSYAEIISKLKESQTYKTLFDEAFKDQPQYSLSIWSVTNALACYSSSLRSFNSPVDQYIRGDIGELDEAVKRGFNLFMGKAACGTCHFGPTFSGLVPPLYLESESEVLGVPTTPDTANLTIDPDLGRIGNGFPREKAAFFKHSFKTVTVRNAALTAPYMHNGVYETLDEVVDFYNRGGGSGMGLDLPYQTLPFSELNLDEEEMIDIVQFMEALTDTTGMTSVPTELPAFEGKPEWNNRPVGGLY